MLISTLFTDAYTKTEKPVLKAELSSPFLKQGALGGSLSTFGGY